MADFRGTKPAWEEGVLVPALPLLRQRGLSVWRRVGAGAVPEIYARTLPGRRGAPRSGRLLLPKEIAALSRIPREVRRALQSPKRVAKAVRALDSALSTRGAHSQDIRRLRRPRHRC